MHGHGQLGIYAVQTLQTTLDRDSNCVSIATPHSLKTVDLTHLNTG
ncbi:MAG: hypothetical protein RL655_793, partial [Pseudomonadota bacterium]